jgi:ABC-type glycerol-3-phosphate transport system substrate-binding protein
VGTPAPASSNRPTPALSGPLASASGSSVGPIASGPTETAAPTIAPYSPPPIQGRLSIWTYAQGDKEIPIRAYIKEFEARHPDIDAKLVVIPEDNYSAKVNTSLQAASPPDVAIIEEPRWIRAGRVVDIAPWLQAWGVPISDFPAGGLARMTVDGDTSHIYGVGDFLGGYVMVYNKALYAAAGVTPPPADRSLSYDEYAANCRAIAKPDPDPAKALYGCSSQDNIYSLKLSDVYGPDGRQIVGNGNSDAMVHAFDVGTSLVNDRVAPSNQVLDAIGGDGEADLFAQGKIAVIPTDFTQVDKYAANGIDFGIVPFYAVSGTDPVLDSWTAPWGTFNGANNPQAALEFLRFIATDAQRMRPTITPDPPLRTSIAKELNYGADDPIKQQYLALLSLHKLQVFVPPGGEAWDPGEVVRQMTVDGKPDARPILDPMVQKAQKELDRLWLEWEGLAP